MCQAGLIYSYESYRRFAAKYRINQGENNEQHPEERKNGCTLLWQRSISANGLGYVMTVKANATSHAAAVHFSVLDTLKTGDCDKKKCWITKRSQMRSARNPRNLQKAGDSRTKHRLTACGRSTSMTLIGTRRRPKRRSKRNDPIKETDNKKFEQSGEARHGANATRGRVEGSRRWMR